MSRKVVIVGGGYGGAAVAKSLESWESDPDGEFDHDVEVVLIDPRDAFVNVAGSLRAVTQPGWAPNIFFPFAGWLRRTTVIGDRVISADPGGVTLASGQRVDADYLVLATGSSYAYPAKPRADSVEGALEELRGTHKEIEAAASVLILGAGPVGLELAGEIKEVWPEKMVTIVDPAPQLLAGFEAELREEVQRQLGELGIGLRLGTTVTDTLPTEAGQTSTFTVATSDGTSITADIWFRAYGVETNSSYLADGRLTPLTAHGQVPVTPTLQIPGQDHIYAIGDLTAIEEAKMAGYASQHAEVVAANITDQLQGNEPTRTYAPLPHPMILLPLGTSGGAGQVPTPEGPAVVPAATVAEYKGTDLFTGRFTERFGPNAS